MKRIEEGYLKGDLETASANMAAWSVSFDS
jgi:hypothetical protein